MIPDWQTNTVYFSALLPGRHPTMWEMLKSVLEERTIQVRLLEGTNDIWAKDYLPIQVDKQSFVQFKFQPDYLCGYEHLQTGPEVGQRIPEVQEIIHSEIRLDGGNIVASSRYALLTEKVFLENPSWSKSSLESSLQQVLKVEKCVFIPTEYCDWIGHADGIVRFLDEKNVVVNNYDGINVSYGNKVLGVLKEHGFHCHFLPYFLDKQPSKSGVGSAVGNYVNYLRIGDLIVVPSYGSREDIKAIGVIRDCLPQADIVSVPCLELAREGGVLNCISWGLQTTISPVSDREKVGQ